MHILDHRVTQVIKKIAPVEAIAQSEVLSWNWVNDSFERKSAHSLLRTLGAQLELLCGQPLENWRAPAFLNIGRMPQGMRRVRTDGGDIYWYDKTNQTLTLAMPMEALKYPYHILTSMTDRDAINVAALVYCMENDFLLCAKFGWFHSLWNDIKGAAKRDVDGLWTCILGFTQVQNINFFPFRSSKAFWQKKDALRDYLATHSHNSASFKRVQEKFACGLNRHVYCEHDAESLFDELGKMRSFNEKGGACKLSRWMSVEECWKKLRQEVWGAKLIYEELGTVDENKTDTGPTTGAQFWKLYNWINERNCFLMDMFCLCTSSLHGDYSNRAKHAKSIEEGFMWNLEYSQGGFFQELVGIATASFYDEAGLRTIGVDTLADDLQAKVNDVTSFALSLLHERVVTVLPELEGYPFSSVAALAPDEHVRTAARQEMLKHQQVLLQVEKLAYFHNVLDEIYRGVVWRNYSICRLLLHTNELEEAHPHGASTDYILEAIHRALPDDKAPEDMHQHLRDMSRTQRHTNVQPTRLMRAALASGVVQSRKLQDVNIDFEKVADMTKHGSSKFPVRHKFLATPTRWPTALDHITDKTGWASPSGPTCFKGVSAWQWLLAWFDDTASWRRNGVELEAAWRSTLLRHKTLLKFGTEVWLVVAAAPWSVLVWQCRPRGEDLYALDMRSPDKLRWRFLCDVTTHVAAPVQGVLVPTQGILLRATGWVSLVAFALKTRVNIDKRHVRQLHVELDTGAPENLSKDESLDALARVVLADDEPSLESFLARNEGGDDNEEPEKLAHDKELSDLLEAIIMHDRENAGETTDMMSAMKNGSSRGCRRLATKKEAIKEEDEKRYQGWAR